MFPLLLPLIFKINGIMQVADKFSIDLKTFNAKWLGVRNSIFYPLADCRKLLTQPVFRKKFEYSFINTGYHFYREDFESFNDVLFSLGEESFVICDACDLTNESRIFEYRVGSGFNEYSPKVVYDDEGFMNTILRYPLNHLVFGKRGDWGLICIEPYDLIIVGFKKNIRSYFLDSFSDRIESAVCWLKNYGDEDFLTKFGKLYS